MGPWRPCELYCLYCIACKQTMWKGSDVIPSDSEKGDLLFKNICSNTFLVTASYIVDIMDTRN